MAKKNKELKIIEAHAGELGNLLRHYRDSIGYSTAEIADALCLSETKIIKLEEEDFETLAEPPYVRGYLRSYAKLANKNPTKLISTYESLRGAAPDELEHHFTPISNNSSKPSIVPVLIKLFLILLILGALIALIMQPSVSNWFKETWNSFSQQTDDKLKNHKGEDNPLLIGNMPSPLPVEQSIPAPAPLQKENQLNISQINAKLADLEKSNEKVTKPENESKANDETNTETTAEDTGKTKVDPTTPSTHAKIKLIFKKEVWLRIKDKNKKTVYEGQTAAGKEKELEFEKPLTFRIGNAQGVSIFIDGKPKDIQEYIKGSVANFTIE